MKSPTRAQTEKAFHVLEQYGRNCYVPEVRNKMLQGQCIGLAVASFTDQVVGVAVAALEDWNYHVEAAALTAIQAGHVKRIGKKLEVTLPDHFDKL